MKSKKPENSAPILELPKNVLETIFNQLDLSDFRLLLRVCHFFGEYDYTKQKARLAKELFDQHQKVEKPQTATSFLYFADPKLHLAAKLGHIEAILLIWETHLNQAIEYASASGIKPLFHSQSQDIEQWAKIEQPFIYYAIIAYHKALKLGDGNSALCSAYKASLLYNKDEKYQKQARQFLYRSNQTPDQFIPQLLKQAEDLTITKDRHSMQKKAAKEVNRLYGKKKAAHRHRTNHR